MKKIMILGGSELQLPAILKAKEMGLQVIVCDYYPDCPGKRVPGVIGELISTYDAEGVLAAAKKHNIDAITTVCTDYPMRVVAYVASELNLPGISPEIAFRATDKAAMRRCMQAHNVPSARFAAAFTYEEYCEALKQFDGRCVVKAVDNSGSRGIQLINDASDKTAADQAFAYCKKFSRSGELLVEEFLEGREVCVETLNYQGECYPIQVTDQLAKEPPYFTDAGYSQPALFPEETLQRIREVAIAANKALDNHTGSSCTEIIVTKDGPRIVEVGPRLAGDYMTSHLVPLSTGVDMMGNVIKIALGEEPDLEPKFSKGSCIRYYMKPVVGKIREIRGLEAAAAVEGVTMVSMMKHVGDEAVPLRSSTDRIAFVIAQAETAQEAIRRCDKALEMIEVIVE